jgi:hypothetical protein
MISRNELYEFVWSEPMSKLAARFDVSGSYLARVCTMMNVPRPERGYWAKLAVGKAPARPSLPESLPGDQTHWNKDAEPPPSIKRPAAPLPAPRAPNRNKRVVRIPLDQVHGLISGAKYHFENGRPTEEGTYLRPYKKILVDVTASKPCLERALQFANDLFNALEAKGYRVTLPATDDLRRQDVDERERPPTKRDPYRHSGPWRPARPTVVYIDRIPIGLSLVEMSEEVLMRYIDGKYVREADYMPSPRDRQRYSFTTTQALPSGRLRLVAYSPHRLLSWSTDWRETPKSGLADRIGSIVRSVTAAAPELADKIAEAERVAEIERQKREEEHQRWLRQEDQRRVEQSVKESKEQLTEVIRHWTEVMGVEQFLVEAETRAAALPEAERERALERLALARDLLGSQDPLDYLLAWKSPTERYRPAYP